MTYTDISQFPVMKKKCATCPFGIDDEGNEYDSQIADTIRARAFQASQICHHPRIKGKPETHLCRGSRDYQLMLFQRIGFLDEPTDEAWEKKRNEQCQHSHGS